MILKRGFAFCEAFPAASVLFYREYSILYSKVFNTADANRALLTSFRL